MYSLNLLTLVFLRVLTGLGVLHCQFSDNCFHCFTASPAASTANWNSTSPHMDVSPAISSYHVATRYCIIFNAQQLCDAAISYVLYL